MEIDGRRDGKIKRNMPLGVTEEGVRVMRGLQAWEPYMSKNNSPSFSISLSLSLQTSPRGRDQFSSSLPMPPGVCSCCWVFVCMCLCVCFFVLLFFIAVGGRVRILKFIPHPWELHNPFTSALFSNYFLFFSLAFVIFCSLPSVFPLPSTHFYLCFFPLPTLNPSSSSFQGGGL